MTKKQANIIPGGYILIARRMLDSEIMKKPPLYLKVWLWLLMNATHKDHKGLKRGQLYTSIPEIQEAMAYKSGYRKVKPSKKQIIDILNWLRSPRGGTDKGTLEEPAEVPMVTTRRGTHGLIVNIVNYSLYQDPNNYGGTNKGTLEEPAEVPMEFARTYRQGHNINKNIKNIQEDIYICSSEMYTEADMPVASAQDMREEEPVQEVSYEMESYTLSGGKGATAKKNKKAEDPALKEKKQQRAQFVEKVFNEVFWPRYPRKVHKKKAKECFEKLFTINIPKEQCTRRLRNIMARLEQLIAENRPIDKIPYPSTFLNAEDFDEAPESDITLAMEVSMQ